SQGKTAFTHKGKAYVWQRLPQGYKNSPNVFQSPVMDVLDGLNATVYIDDVFIADDTEEDNLRRLKAVVERISEVGLKLNLRKCQFGQFQVNYLGFQVSTDLGLSDAYREKIERITPPTAVKELQRIMGLCNYVQDHVPGYQKHPKPLYARLKKTEETTFTWTATDQGKLENLQKAIKEAVRLQPQDHTTRVVAVVSIEENDAVVSVSNEGKQLITLWSYASTTVEQKYPDLAQGQQIQIITQSQVHRYLRKGTVESTKAMNTRIDAKERPGVQPPRPGQLTAPRRGQEGQGAARRTSYLSQEEYDKLDKAEKDALRAERNQANGGLRK
ncbi:hypothetical protein CRUP_006921, partial [Coryphaenoides rupestris]